MRQHYTILVVDDEEPLRLSLSLILQKEDYHVTTAGNVEEALRCLQQQEYDLLFLDLNMPGRNGIDLLLEIHKRFPDLPVLILTAYAALESAIQALRLGARDYLIKPAEPALLLRRVAEILADREQPARKKEIVDEIQALLSELQKIEKTEAMPASADPARVLKKGIFELNTHERHATLNGNYIPVSGVYFDYLATLLRHAPKAVAYKALVRESQSYDVDLAEARETARWRIHELRRVIELDPQHPQYILTVRGTGYRLAT